MPKCGSPTCCGRISRSRIWKRRWRTLPAGSGAMADDKAVEVPVSMRAGDLPTRLVSAVVLLALAGTALAIGGAVLDAFILLVALIGFVELVRLVLAASR